MASAKEIILEYVCPALGMVIGNVMFAAPVRDLKAAIDKGDLGTLNPTPWGFMLGNCLGWVLYGALLQNYWVFFGNAPGLLVSIWLNMGAIKLLYQGHHIKEKHAATVAFLDREKPLGGDFARVDSFLHEMNSTDEGWGSILLKVTSQTTPAPTRHENIVMLMCTLWATCGTILAFANSMDLDAKVTMVGIVTNCILIFFYGGPLSTIKEVLTEKHTASIHIPTMILNTMNSSFWCAYGIAVSDYFVAGPNGLGSVFGAIQIFLYMTFPRNPKTQGATEKTGPETKGDPPRGSGATQNVELANSTTLVKSVPLDGEDGTLAASA